MADRRIDQLTEAEDISDEDLFVIWKQNISQTRSIAKGTMNLATRSYVDSKVPNYTTTEQDTGKKWIDGKTIYRAVIPLSTVPGTLSLATYGITPEEVISLTGMGYNATHPTDKVVANCWFSDFNWSIYYRKSENAIMSRATNDVTNGFYIIEYTKA